jgi:hypothetical protein
MKRIASAATASLALFPGMGVGACGQGQGTTTGLDGTWKGVCYTHPKVFRVELTPAGGNSGALSGSFARSLVDQPSRAKGQPQPGRFGRPAFRRIRGSTMLF